MPPDHPLPRLVIIAAVARNRVIGTGRGLPWHLPAESRRFRAYCAGRWMLLGRRTWSEMTGWFTTQTPLVLTRSARIAPPGRAVRSLDEALSLAADSGADELVVAGGAEVYALALPRADRLILSEIDHDATGSLLFPEFRESDWRLVSEQPFPAGPENEHAFRLVVREKIR